jgi:hypothetical protein
MSRNDQMRYLTQQSLSFAAVMLISVLAGCKAQTANESQGSQVKPIDRVREGIVALQAHLKGTLASSTSLANGGWGSRERFSQDLQETQRCAQTLQSDSAELRERASDYLAAWSGNTYIITRDSHARGTDTQRGVVEAKYDEFVNSMLAAKEVVLPLLEQLKTIEASHDSAAVRANLQQAESQEAQATQALDEALARMDELKHLLQASGN